MVLSVLLGATVGKERAGKHHPAGVRTMSLVSLGACLFTLCSLFGFRNHYDTSRMASNVASGVGFIGAGVITTTNTEKSHDGSVVHGLTTAAAIWLSAAVGVACAVGLCVLGAAGTALTLLVLRTNKKATESSVQRIEDWFRRSNGTESTVDVLEERVLRERRRWLNETDSLGSSSPEP